MSIKIIYNDTAHDIVINGKLANVCPSLHPNDLNLFVFLSNINSGLRISNMPTIKT
jgi:hypothetical protein